MGEQDAPPSTQDAFPITEPQVIITPQVTSGRVVHALMKFLPREVMVEVVEEVDQRQGQGQEQEDRGLDRVPLSEPAGVGLRVLGNTGDFIPFTRLSIAAPMEPIVRAEVIEVDAMDQPAALVPVVQRLPKIKSPPARRRSPPVVPEQVVAQAGAVVAIAHPSALLESLVMGDAGLVSTSCDPASGGEVAVTSSRSGPSSPLSALDFSRLSAFADDPPSGSRGSGPAIFPGSRRLSGLARWMVPDYVGRAIQHPTLQILAGIGVSLLVLWWILGQ